jgi:hypothetical protein
MSGVAPGALRASTSPRRARRWRGVSDGSSVTVTLDRPVLPDLDHSPLPVWTEKRVKADLRLRIAGNGLIMNSLPQGAQEDTDRTPPPL